MKWIRGLLLICSLLVFFISNGYSTSINNEQLPESNAVYLKDTARETLQQDTSRIYTCPMHPEISWPKPDKCPKCGMDLVLKKADRQVRAEYTCPMHPDVISDKPGKCPKCGMDLVVKGSNSGMNMGCMGMMHGNGRKTVWMYIAGGAMVAVMATMMFLRVLR